MYPYITCTCGRSLGDLYDAFKAMKLKKYEAAYGANATRPDPAMIAISEHIQISLADELDQLHLKLDCCRVKMLGQVEFKDLY